MNNPVTICKIHGEINIENAKKINTHGYPGFRCNICVKKEKQRSYYEKNKDKLRKQKRISDLKYVDKRKNQSLKRDFNITLETYNKLLENQNYLCKICKNPEIVKSKFTNQIRNLAVDHCHVSKKVRGLLCSRCNQMIGMAKESITILESAIDYLKNSI